MKNSYDIDSHCETFLVDPISFICGSILVKDRASLWSVFVTQFQAGVQLVTLVYIMRYLLLNK